MASLIDPSDSHRLRSFGVIRIRIRISDPRSVWIMVHQRNRQIHEQSGFTGSFDVHDPDRSWITDQDPDHPKGTQPKIFVQYIPPSKGDLHQIKDQMDHLVSVHNQFISFARIEGSLYVPYRFQRITTGIFVQNSSCICLDTRSMTFLSTGVKEKRLQKWKMDIWFLHCKQLTV